MIPRATLIYILAEHYPDAAPALFVPLNPRQLHVAISKAIAQTAYNHGHAEGSADPWDYTRDDIAHAIAEWISHAEARTYRAEYDRGYQTGANDRAARKSRTTS